MFKSIGKEYKFALSAVLMWSTVATAFKLALGYLNPIELLFIACITSFIVMSIYLMFLGKLKETLKITKRDIINSSIFGFLNPILYYFVLFNAYDLLPAQEAMSLNYSWGITLAVLSVIILKQKITLMNFLGLFLSLVGVMFIAFKGDFTNFNFESPLGISLALGSSVIWGLYWVLNIDDIRVETRKLFYNFAFSCIYITIIAILTGNIPTFHLEAYSAGIYVGIFEMGITFLVWMKALKYAPNAAKISNIIYLTPFISMLLIAFVLKETIVFATIIGLFFIIIGILLQHYRRK